MQEALSQPLQPQIIPFSKFLVSLVQELERAGVRPCVLRNYEGFPATNIGNDIDFLILPSELPRAIRALCSIDGIRIVGYTPLEDVASVFLEGVSSTSQGRSIQIDFDLSLSWKGLPYLPTDAVLEAAIPRPAGNETLFVPAPVHEAIVSLFASLLVGGWLKERYFPKVQRIFVTGRADAIAALKPQFGEEAAKQLVDTVIGGDRRKIHGCIRPLRIALALRSLLRSPLHSIAAIVRHYGRVSVARYSPRSIETVCIMGPDGCGQGRLIECLMPILHSSANVVEERHFKQCLPLRRAASGVAKGAGSEAESLSGWFASMAAISVWLVEEWWNQFFGKSNFTLRVCDRFFDDLLIVPQRYHYGGPMWFARLIGRLSPSPDLWILLDPLTEEVRSRDTQPMPAETRMQLEAYRRLVKTRKRYVILDASKPATEVTEGAYAAIIDMLAERTNKVLKNRF